MSQSILAHALVIRPSADIWHTEEPEGYVPGGGSRPLLIADEQVTHLAHTDKRLMPEELLVRAQEALLAQQVPVTIYLQNVRWQRERDQPRPRLVAFLSNHAYSHLKLLFGVDYLGQWASLQMQLAYQPDPLPVSRAPFLRFVGTVCMIAALVLFVLQLFGGYEARAINPFADQPAMGLGLAVMGTVAGLVFLSQARRAERQEEREQAQKQAQRLARTFAVDDMRLFCSAMQAVFQSIVDDIVAQGGEVTRIDGGQGGFFQSQGVTQAVPPPGRTDAANLGV